MSAELDRTTLARAILSAIRLRVLREEIRNRRVWRETVFPGFRPDSITRSVAGAAAPRFATAPRMLSDLIEVFIHDLGSEGAEFSDRQLAAASDPRVPPDTQDALRLSAEAKDLSELPVRAAQAAAGPAVERPVAQPKDEERLASEPATTAEPVAPIEEAAPEEPAPTAADPAGHVHASQPKVAPGEPPPFEWSPPPDDSDDIQSAVTLFGRSVSAFIVFRLQALYGDAWLRKGCGPYRKSWQDREKRPGAVEPETLLGYAWFDELKEIIISRDNWTTFSPYFPTKEWVASEFKLVSPLRQAGMHSEQRALYKSQHFGAFSCMSAITACFHLETADAIDLLWSEEQSTAGIAEDDETLATLFRVQKNFPSLPTVELMGREDELARLHAFWDDDFERVICVTGRGGVGKTALVHSFVNELLSRPCKIGERPNPELVLSLTAKENWLEDEVEWLKGQVRPPAEQQFGSLRRVLEAFIDLCGGTASSDSEMGELRDEALTHAREIPCLILLDNLETLPDEELEQLGTFVRRLPAPSKVILTDRERRAFGERLELRGIDNEAAVALVESRAAHDGVTIPGTQRRAIARVSEELNGVPLYLHFFANLLVNGHKASDALAEIRGRGMLWLLQFSFDSSVEGLSESGRELLYYLALVPDPVTRSDLLQVVKDGEELDDAVRRLRNAHFIENVEMGSFRITDPQLREYVINQFPARIKPAAASRVQYIAGAPVQSHPNIERAIQQLIKEAAELGRSDWERAYDRLNRGRAEFGEVPHILAQLGYFAYRLQRREEARNLLEIAIASGYQDANTHRTLGLVYYYEGSFDEAIRQAETSLTLRPDDPRSLLLLGEAQLRKAARSTIALDPARQLELVQQARSAIHRSLIEDDFARWQREHNVRRTRLLERAEELEGSLVAVA